MSIEQDLKKIDELQKSLTKQIDDEVALDEEIQEVAKITAKLLESKPMVPFSIQNREFILVAAMHTKGNVRCMQLVAREKSEIVTPNAKLIKADFEMDLELTKEENLCCGIKALLGHITGLIKPETLD